VTPEEYIAAHVPHAQAERARYGVPASVSLAQGLLESGRGTSILAVKGHAHHGIKASTTTKAGVTDNPHSNGEISKATGEYLDGAWTTVDAVFLAFPSDLAGYLGHGWYLTHRGLYDKAFAASDAEGFARAMAGIYATDPAYATKILALIDKYDLTQYDREAPMRIVLSPSSQEHNPCKAGDTEQAHCRLIARKTADLLNAAGQEAFVVITGDDNLSDSDQLAQMANASNALNADLHVDIHTDAGGAVGPSAFYTGTGRSMALAKAIYTEVNAVVPWAGGGTRDRSELYMLRKTTASACLVECWPHDRAEQAAWGHAHIDDVAAAIARGVLTITGGTLPDDTTEEFTVADNEKLKFIDDRTKRLEDQTILILRALGLDKYGNPLDVVAVDEPPESQV